MRAWFGLVYACLGLHSVGCGTDSGSGAQAGSSAQDETAVVQCRTASDCGSNQTCSFEQQLAGRRLLQEVEVGPRCTAPRACESDAECADIDGVCHRDGDARTLVPPSPPNCIPFGGAVPMHACVERCTADSCSSDAVCGEDGHCSTVKCTEPDAEPCPEYWICDAVVAGATLTPAQLRTPGGLTTTGALVSPLESHYQRGCVLLRCDAPGGSPCVEGYQCDTATAAEDSVGCVPVPCEQLGRCSDDAEYVCAPPAGTSRPDGIDLHGCVRRNCDEGLACPTGRVCESAHPEADVSGCRVLLCSEDDSVCQSGFSCDASRANSDVQGCYPVSCVDGFECSDGWTCEPGSNLGNDGHDCAPPLSLVCPECILPEPVPTPEQPAPDPSPGATPVASTPAVEPALAAPEAGDDPAAGDEPFADEPGAPEQHADPAPVVEGSPVGICR